MRRCEECLCGLSVDEVCDGRVGFDGVSECE